MEVAGYADLSRIGSGSFGEVYRARQLSVERHVAIKFIRHDHVLDSRVRERFDREVKLLGKLGEHRRIVTIFDAGFDKSGIPYIVMQYLPNGSLADNANRTRQSESTIIKIGVQMAEALAVAHENKVLHRDIKPANILITPESDFLLGDFGISSFLVGSIAESRGTAGTLPYMAPELFVAPGGAARATDLYALGVTLYELASGELPFKGDGFEVVGPIIAGEYQQVRGVSANLRTVIDRLLSKNPTHRYPSARDLASDLSRLATSQDVTNLTSIKTSQQPERHGVLLSDEARQGEQKQRSNGQRQTATERVIPLSFSPAWMIPFVSRRNGRVRHHHDGVWRLEVEGLGSIRFKVQDGQMIRHFAADVHGSPLGPDLSTDVELAFFQANLRIGRDEFEAALLDPSQPQPKPLAALLGSPAYPSAEDSGYVNTETRLDLPSTGTASNNRSGTRSEAPKRRRPVDPSTRSLLGNAKSLKGKSAYRAGLGGPNGGMQPTTSKLQKMVDRLDTFFAITFVAPFLVWELWLLAFILDGRWSKGWWSPETATAGVSLAVSFSSPVLASLAESLNEAWVPRVVITLAGIVCIIAHAYTLQMIVAPYSTWLPFTESYLRLLRVL